MHDITEETTILDRLARAHKGWRDSRPPPPPPMTPEEESRQLAEIFRRVQNPEPQDVVAIREAREDPLGTARWSSSYHRESWQGIAESIGAALPGCAMLSPINTLALNCRDFGQS